MIGDAVSRMFDDVADKATDRVVAVGVRLALLIAAGLAVLGGLVAAAMAFFWWLEPKFGPVLGALATAAAFWLLAVCVYVAARVAGKPKPAAPIKPVQVLEEEGRETVDTLGGVQFLLVAAGVGALAGLKVSGSRGEASSGPSIASIISSAMSTYAAISSTDAAKDASHAAEQTADHPTA